MTGELQTELLRLSKEHALEPAQSRMPLGFSFGVEDEMTPTFLPVKLNLGSAQKAFVSMKVHVERGGGFYIVLHRSRQPPVDGRYTVMIYIEPPKNTSNKGSLYVANNQPISLHEHLERQPVTKKGGIGHLVSAPNFDVCSDTSTSIGYLIEIDAKLNTVTVEHYGESKAYNFRKVVAKQVVGLGECQFVGVLPGGPQVSQVNVSDAQINSSKLPHLNPEAPLPPKVGGKGPLRPRKPSSAFAIMGGGAAQPKETVWQWLGDGNVWTDQMPEVTKAVEAAHQAGDASVTCTIRGKPYVINLKKNFQYWVKTPGNKRQVRRVEGSNSSDGGGGGGGGVLGAISKGIGGLLGGLLGPVVAAPSVTPPPAGGIDGGDGGGGGAAAAAGQWQVQLPAGWVAYDDSATIEAAWAMKKPSAKLTIAGKPYTLDFAKKYQYMDHTPKRIRSIRRVPGATQQLAPAPTPAPAPPSPAPAPAEVARWQWKDGSSWKDFPHASQLKINDAESNGLLTTEIEAGGRTYVVDLSQKIQYQKSDQFRQRPIRKVTTPGVGAVAPPPLLHAVGGGGGGGGAAGIPRPFWEWKSNGGWLAYPKDVSDGISAARLNGDTSYTYTRSNGDSYIVTFTGSKKVTGRQSRSDDPTRVRSVRAPEA